MSEQTPPETATAGYYFNTETQEVEHGLHSSWASRLGPYETREEAEAALGTARLRSAQWDSEDEEADR